MLSDRQELLLRRVVESYVELGQPVGSKWLTSQPGIEWSASTVRYDLAALEQAGYLDHPHTSAGRIPTNAGYRVYVDSLMEQGSEVSRPAGLELKLSSIRREVDSAVRATTEALSQVTDLVAAVSAPPPETATIKHVEVLALQPQVVLVVVISSTGEVTKRAFTFEHPVDQGLVEWAASFLNERLVGMEVGALMLPSRLEGDHLSSRESGFLETVKPAFSNLASMQEDTVYVEGTSRLLGSHGFSDLDDMNDLMRTLERRVSLLSVLRSVLDGSTVHLSIGEENALPELRSASIVAAGYGLGHRTLGAVSVIGPVRMDYPTAIGSVREAAQELSRFVEDVYE